MCDTCPEVLAGGVGVPMIGELCGKFNEYDCVVGGLAGAGGNGSDRRIGVSVPRLGTSSSVESIAKGPCSGEAGALLVILNMSGSDSTLGDRDQFLGLFPYLMDGGAL